MQSYTLTLFAVKEMYGGWRNEILINFLINEGGILFTFVFVTVAGVMCSGKFAIFQALIIKSPFLPWEP